MPIKSFRGMMGPDTMTRINLHTNNGKMGYRMKKLQVMTKNPMSGTTEAVIKVYSVSQSSITSSVDFSEETLLAVGIMVTTEAQDMAILEYGTFNQDIFITYATAAGTDPANFYLELEQVPLDLNEQTVATLKDIRNAKTQLV